MTKSRARLATIGLVVVAMLIGVAAPAGADVAPKWTKHFGGAANSTDGANSVAVTLDGAVAVVAGQSADSQGHWDFVTIAYEVATGHRLWVRQYGGPTGG